MYFVHHIKQRSGFSKKYLTGNRLSVEFELLQCNIFLVLERLHPRLQNLFDHLFWRYKMYATPEQFAATNKASVDALFTIAHAQFAAFERLSALNFNTTKVAFEDSVNQAKALLSVKDAQEFVNLSAASAQPALEKAIAYSRNVYEVATQTQAEVTKLAETQAAEMNKTVVSLMDKLTKNAPAGSDVAVAAVKSAMAAANSAYDSFTKVVKQATDMAEANVTAATATVVKEAGKKKAA
jgi:phasin family protein